MSAILYKPINNNIKTAVFPYLSIKFVIGLIYAIDAAFFLIKFILLKNRLKILHLKNRDLIVLLRKKILLKGLYY